MKLFFYFFLPFLMIRFYWMYLVGAILVIFLIPGNWWKRNPESQPDKLIGKLLPFMNISLRNLTLRLFAIAAFFLLLPGFLIFLVALIVFWLPVILVAKLLSRDPAAKETPLLGFFLMCCLVVLIIAGLLAPMNLVPIALYFLMGRPAGNTIEFLAIGKDAVRDDALMGLVGILVVSLILLLDAFWRLRQARQVENLPTSKVGSVSLGLVELKGTARKIGSDRDNPILQLRMDPFDYLKPHQKLEPFFLEDESGQILVDPRRCRIRTGWITDLINLFSGFHEVVLNERVQRNDKTDAVTRTMMDGDPVYVIGSAEVNQEKAEATGEDRLVIRPSARSNWNPSLWRFLFGSAKLPPGKDILNVFFISDSREEVATKHILRGFRTVWLISFFWLFTSVFLIWSSYWPVRQEMNPEGWRNAYWRESDSISRLLRFEKYMESLAPQTTAGIPALIEAIGYEDRRYKEPATSALVPMIPALNDRAAKVVLQLRTNLQTTDAHLLQTTILALAAFGPEARSAVPELIEQLKCQSTNTYEVTPNIIRFQAAVALGRIGPSASEATQDLTRALDDPSPFVRDAARHALIRIEQ